MAKISERPQIHDTAQNATNNEQNRTQSPEIELRCKNTAF